MTKYVQLRPDLYLVQHAHNKQVTSKKPQAQNHVWLFDRSGSMYDSLPDLIQDLKEQARTLKKGDTVTLGWFSGTKEYNYIIKGFKISDDSDFKTLEAMLDKHVRTVGLTCFSEILASTKQVIEDLKVFSPSFSLMFFTDGFPTVGNPHREIESIFNAIADIRGDVTAALLVAYGSYYNKNLMTDMAERLGAGLIHSDTLPEFRVAMDGFLKDASTLSKKVKVTLDVPYTGNQTKYPSAFAVQGSTVTILAQDADQSVYFTETDNPVDYIYVLSGTAPKGEAVSLTEQDVKGSGQESLVKGVYAAAFVLCQLGKTDQAMDALASIGDVYLINKLTNAYTPSEYGEAEKALTQAAQEPQHRYRDGFKKNYLPKPDAFCLLDALDVLLDDPKAAFYPYHETFKYKRIGVKASAVNEAPAFVPESNVKVPISSLVWNSSMLNLSVYAKIEGKIRLTGNYAKLGFAENYPTWVNRNYTLVKDGFLNLKTLPVSLSEESFRTLRAQGMLDEPVYAEDLIYSLKLDRVPTINRKMAEGKTSAADLADKVLKEQELKAKLKVLKYFKDQEQGEAPEKVGVFASLSDEQVALLEANFIGKNGFAPKVEKEESKDHYIAKEFDIKVKGLSSFPKIVDVQAKLKAGKKLTGADEMVKAGISLYENSGMATQSREVKLAWLNSKITEFLKEQRGISRGIQEAKFSVLLGKKWYDEFSTREENTLVHKGHTLTFALREVEVPI